MKKNYISFFAILSSLFATQLAYSQCTTTAVKEAVDNGSFEKGYPQSGTTATKYADGSTLAFKSDLTYAGDWSPTGANKYGIGEMWGIGKQEATPCNGGIPNFPPYGVGYTNTNTWADHTKGTKDGYALIVDLFFCTGPKAVSKLYAGGMPIIWAQDVNLYQNQNYYFSAWIAQYTSVPTTSTVNLVVIPYVNNVLSVANRVVVKSFNPSLKSMNWEQLSGTWNSATFTKALITIEVDPTSTNCEQGGDFAIDDISFINSCQNVTNNLVPDLGKTQSLCATDGTIILDAKIPTIAGNNRKFYWYTGTGATQFQYNTSSTTDNTLNVGTLGTYRVDFLQNMVE